MRPNYECDCGALVKGTDHAYEDEVDFHRRGFCCKPAAEVAYTPKVGDRVRFTAKGVVTDTGRFDTTLVTLDGCLNPNAIQVGVGTWEKLLDPLPTTPGSVVRCGDDLLHMTRAGFWISDEGKRFTTSDVIGATVLFDAGAS